MKITDSQRTFLRRLLDESFANLCGTCGTNLDRNHLDGVSRDEASKAIDTLLARKRSGWGKLDVWSEGRTGRLIGTVRRNGDGRFGAYSYKRSASETFATEEEAVAWVRA